MGLLARLRDGWAVALALVVWLVLVTCVIWYDCQLPDVRQMFLTNMTNRTRYEAYVCIGCIHAFNCMTNVQHSYSCR